MAPLSPHCWSSERWSWSFGLVNAVPCSDSTTLPKVCVVRGCASFGDRDLANLLGSSTLLEKGELFPAWSSTNWAVIDEISVTSEILNVFKITVKSCEEY